MQFGVRGADLARGLSLGETAVNVDKTGSLVLLNVRIEAKDGELHLALTDLDTSVQFTVPADVTEEGVVLVNAKKLLDIAKRSKQTSIQFAQVDNNPASVKFGSFSFELPITDAGLFPNLDEPVECPFGLPARVFNSLIDRTIYAASPSKKYGTATDAVRFEPMNGEISGIATDTARVATATFAWSPGEDFPALNVPKRVASALYDLTKLIGETEDMERMVRFSERDTKIYFTFGNLFLASLKPNVDFPQLRPVLAKIPRDNCITLVPADFREALIDATLIEENDSKGVIITVSNNRLSLQEWSYGKADGSLACQYDGVDAQVALRVKTILAFLDSATRGGGEEALSFFIPLAPRTPVVFSFLSADGRSELLQSPVDLKS